MHRAHRSTLLANLDKQTDIKHQDEHYVIKGNGDIPLLGHEG